MARPLAGGKSIAGAAVILVAGFMASRLVGLLREVVIGARFGTSPDYDVYLAAFRIPDTVFILVAGGALGSALVPVFADYRGRQEGDGLPRLASTVFNLVSAAATLAAMAGIIFAPQVVPLVGAGFEPEQQARLATLVRVMLLQPVFFGMGEVVTRYLNVHQHFFYPALAPTIYNLAIVGAALVSGPAIGTFGLAVGVVAGALLYLLVQLPAATTLGFRWHPGLDLRDPGLRQIACLMLPRMVGQGAVQLSFIVTTRLASYLPAGSIAALGYAWTLMMLPLGIFAMSLANAVFPTLAAQAAAGERDRLAAAVRRSLGTILFLMVPSAAGLIIAGFPLVQTLYQRQAFTVESSALTAVALAMFAAGLPAHGAIEILTRSFYAMHDTRTPVIIGVAAMALNVAIATALVLPLQHVGIALALSTSATAEAGVLLLLLHRRLPRLLTTELVWSFTGTALAGLALAGAASVAVGVTRFALNQPPLIQTAAAALLGGGAYLLAAYLLHSPDLFAIVQRVRRRLGREYVHRG